MILQLFNMISVVFKRFIKATRQKGFVEQLQILPDSKEADFMDLDFFYLSCRNLG